MAYADASARFVLIAGILTTAFYSCGLGLRSRFKLGIMGLDRSASSPPIRGR